MKTKRRTGRPGKPIEPGTRVMLGLRVEPETKERLEGEAARSGRSQSQQAERAIDAFLDDRRRLLDVLEEDFGRGAAAMMLLVGQLAADVLRAVDRPLSDRWTFDRLREAIDNALKEVTPPGEPTPPPLRDLAAAAHGEEWARERRDNIGHDAARAVLRSIFERKHPRGPREEAIKRGLSWGGGSDAR